MQRLNAAQMAFDLDLDEVQVDAAERAITAEEARLISETARRNFTGEDEKPEWFNDYLRLIEQRWPWRVAAYMAWASAPKRKREPKTLNELATVLGLTSPRAIHTWREKFPSIDTMTALMQAQPLFEHRRDFIEALIASGTDPDYKGFNDRKLAFEMMGDYVRKSEQTVGLGKAKGLEEFSDAELRAMMGVNGFGERIERMGEEGDGEEGDRGKGIGEEEEDVE
jgi:hypothetical protein